MGWLYNGHGRCVTGGLRAHGHCNNRPAGHKQGSERTQSWIRDWGKVMGSIDEDNMPGRYLVHLWERDHGGNPWIEILEFREKSGDGPDQFIVDLDFSLYDKASV